MFDSELPASRKSPSTAAAVGPLASVLADEQSRLQERAAALADERERNGPAEALTAQADLQNRLSVLEHGIAATRHEKSRAADK